MANLSPLTGRPEFCVKHSQGRRLLGSLLPYSQSSLLEAPPPQLYQVRPFRQENNGTDSPLW